MKFRLVGQIYVYSIENWILVSYQAPKQRPRSCQKEMVQCPKNTVLKLKVTTGWFSMVFQLFHGPGIPVWSPIPEQQHRAVGRRAVLRSSSCLRPGRAAWHGFGRDQPPRETSWNMVFSCFFTLLSLSRLRFFTLVSPGDLGDTSKLAEISIFIHFLATKSNFCWVKR